MDTAKAPTITDFLLARIAEDEAAARAVAPLEVIYPMGGQAHPQTFTHARMSYASEDCYPRTLSDPQAATHFARHDPARALAECAAKRAIVQTAQSVAAGAQDPEPGLIRAALQTAEQVILEGVLRPMVRVYADHPDYDPAWAN